MARDYKKVIKNKRLEAGKLMTEKQIGQCNAAIHTATVAAGAAGAIPIPVADAIPISAAQVTMVIALGKIFDQEITSAAAKGAISAAASTFAGRTILKAIPGVNVTIAPFVCAAIAAGITEAIGWTVAVDMAKNYRKEYERKKAAEEAADSWAEAKKYRQAQDDVEADDFSDT